MTQLRRLTPAGLARMHTWLDQLAVEGRAVDAVALFDEPEHSEVVEPRIDIESRPFASRHEWACYIDAKLAAHPQGSLQTDRGLWAWLSLFYFDQVCPPGADGRRRVGARARYISSGSDYRTYYRHLLEGPWRVVRAHRDRPERALAVLAGPLHAPGELAEQLMSRMDLVTSPSVMQTATTLYIHPGTRKPKRGAGGAKGGSPRRFADVLLQFDRTYDIYAMPHERLLTLLPREFDRFKAPAAGG